MYESYCITPKLIAEYVTHLREMERAPSTIQKYTHDLISLMNWFDGKELSKGALLEWKEHLSENYTSRSVNSILAAVNGLLSFCGWNHLKVKLLKIQRRLFSNENRELTREEYIRLVRAAQQSNNLRLSLVLQTICSTGIRVSELRFITVEAVRAGRVEVNNKGKFRVVFLPNQLCRLLRNYLKEQNIITGAVFISKNGKPLDRSNIWRDMKSLCERAHVAPGKVFPHNLRHLFARTYYALEKDLSRLADILGHTSIATTRIYTMETGLIHAQQMTRLGLIVT